MVLAIWVEDENGNFVSTIFIGNFIGRHGHGNNGNPDFEVDGGDRRSALPVWAYSRGVIDNTHGCGSYYPPAEDTPNYPEDVDAVSSATPSATETTKVWDVEKLPNGTYNVFLEANVSFDTNAYHDYDAPYFLGQPSVVWKVSIDIGANPVTAQTLDYAGYGSYNGTNGDLNPPDKTITTAAELLVETNGYRLFASYTP